jgi:hypothetical protein
MVCRRHACHYKHRSIEQREIRAIHGLPDLTVNVLTIFKTFLPRRAKFSEGNN